MLNQIELKHREHCRGLYDIIDKVNEENATLKDQLAQYKKESLAQQLDKSENEMYWSMD